MGILPQTPAAGCWGPGSAVGGDGAAPAHRTAVRMPACLEHRGDGVTAAPLQLGAAVGPGGARCVPHRQSSVTQTEQCHPEGGQAHALGSDPFREHTDDRCPCHRPGWNSARTVPRLRTLGGGKHVSEDLQGAHLSSCACWLLCWSTVDGSVQFHERHCHRNHRHSGPESPKAAPARPPPVIGPLHPPQLRSLLNFT